MKSRAFFVWSTVLLALLGIGDSFYLAQHEITDTALSCGVGNLSGCNIVAQSPYSHLLGIPLGIWGIVFYVLVLVGFLIALSKPRPLFFRGLALLTTIGLLFSLYFFYLQVYIIKAICIYCMGSLVLTVLLFLFSIAFWRMPQLLLRSVPERQSS